MYMGTNILGMTEREFWRCTPRTLISMYNQHLEYHGKKPEEHSEENAIKAFMGW